jgi:major coat protein
MFNLYNKAKNFAAKGCSKLKGVAAAGLIVIGTSLGFSSDAAAAIPAEATTAIAGVQTDGEAMIAAGWPVVAAIVGGLILIKLFKKVMGKVS